MRRRRIITALVVVGLCLGVLVTRAMWEGRDALARGDEAHEDGDSAEAIRWWRRAARWYVPGAPHVDGAYERLEALAEAAEQRGDVGTAIAAWTGVRSSVLATRSFYTPHPERKLRADEHLALLQAKNENPQVAGDATVEARRQWHYQLLQRDTQPSVGWTVFALLGMALWIGGGFAFALRGVDREDRLVPRAALYAGSAVALGLVLWLVGLYQA